MLRKLFWCYALLITSMAFQPALGQHASALDSLYAELDSLFDGEAIPSDLFALADSILAVENAKASAVIARAGYVSEIVSAGRTLGVSQYGFTPGVSYYHHSGFGAGISGYWSSENDPAYYLTDVNVNYVRFFKEKLTLMASHNFYIYNDSLPNHSFNKAAQASVGYRYRFIDAGIDYAFLYGNESAHRVTGHANLHLKLKTRGFIDAITFMPGFALQWGNADVIYWRQPRTALTDLHRIVTTNDYPRLTFREYLRLGYLLNNDRLVGAALFLRQRDYSDEQIQSLYDQYTDGEYTLNDTFGLMNLSISCPVVIRSGRFSLLLNYTFNRPYALPGEEYNFENNSYFSSSLSYALTWLKK